MYLHLHSSIAVVALAETFSSFGGRDWIDFEADLLLFGEDCEYGIPF